MWYSNVLIELFQSEFSSCQRSDRYVDKSPLSAFCLTNFGTGKLQLFQIITYDIFSNFVGMRGRGESGHLLGNAGSVAACNRKRGPINY